MPPAPKLGRGGREHKYLQNLIKRLAEDRGYKATIEQPVLDGTGSIDVALEKGERRIACEISVTTSADHEIGNIQKCLASGYETVLVVSSDPKTLRAVRAAVEKQLEPSTLDRIQFLPSEDFSGYLDELSADDAGHEETVRGYKVRTRFKSVSEAEAKARKQAISQVLLKRRKRLKDPK